MARMRARLVLVALVAASLSAQTYRVQPVEGPRDAAGEIALTAEPGSDDWASEGLFAAWDASLGEFSKALEKGGPLDGFFTPEFAGTALEPESFRSRKSGVLVAGDGIPPQLEIDREAFLDKLERLRSSFHKIEAAKLKLVSIEGEASNVVYFLSGTGLSGGPLQLRGEWRLGWRRDEAGSWRIRRLQAGPVQRSEAGAKSFTDVTGYALGSNPSFREQLLPGLDAWRRRLDASLGVAVPGHHGLSVADVDGDGWEDIYVLQPAGLPNRLYLNRGGLRFEDAGAGSGLEILDPSSHALFADFDGDEDLDLFLVSSRLMLFLNDGRGRFSLAQNSGLEGFADRDGSWMGAAAADFDRDGRLDVYVCAHTQSAWSSTTDADLPEPYHDANNGAPNVLLANRGARFEDVTQKAGLDVNNRRFSFAAAWADYDADGDPDLYVANDFGRNNLYRNEGDGMFRDVAAEAGVEDLAAGMSAAWEDYDNDGRLDLYVGNMWSSAGLRVTGQDRFEKGRTGDEAEAMRRHARGNSLYRNLGDGTFADATAPSGTALGRWAWSSDFFDFDNDGWEDLYVSNGFITGEDTGDL